MSGWRDESGLEAPGQREREARREDEGGGRGGEAPCLELQPGLLSSVWHWVFQSDLIVTAGRHQGVNKTFAPFSSELCEQVGAGQ